MTDWGFYWDLIAHISQVGLVFIRAYFLCRFVNPFLSHGEGRRYKLFWENGKHSLYMLLPGISYAVVLLFCAFCSQEVNVVLVYVVSTIAAFVVTWLIDRRNAEQKIFLALTFYLLQWITWGITLVPWRGVYDFLLFTSGRQNNYLIQFVLYVVMELFNLVLHCLSLALGVRMIHKEYHCKRENMTKRELALMSAPFFSVAAGQGIFYFAVDAYEKDTGQYIWNHYSAYTLLQAVFMLISFGAMLTVIASYQRIRSSQRKEKEDAVLAGQIEEMKRHISEVEKLYLDIRSLKHDMGNHIMTLEKLCETNKEAGAYITQLKEQVSGAMPETASGNPVTDVILREKQKEAEEKKITFTHRFHFPEETDLSAFDVSVILNNALNNAMEAAGECENPYISLSSCRRKNAYMIEIRNSVVQRRSIDEESGLPLTTKEGADHGFGLVNIRKVAQKYYGDIIIEQSENEFSLVVMLMV
ncbi:MAG: GHKL domain-containing protein [Lachnospiraceae bacterium]|nr:GHKL domain-containing protein [Lachnospiraceae bacterium]